jgi:tRNA acetyltransferase TAN1
MLDWIEENKLRIEPDESWKLTINKRHSALKSKSLITEIASKIERTVNLKHPDKIIQIEIIGKFIGLAVLKPFQIIQLSHLIKEKVIEEESEIENDV